MARTLTEAASPNASAQEVLWDSLEFNQLFGVTTHPLRQANEYKAALQEIDPRYKGGRELVRFQLEQDQTEWSEETKEVIMLTAGRMRMLETETPLTGDYTAVIALGGARQSNLDRTRYAARALMERSIKIGHLVVAGSARELNEAEQANVENYAPGAVDEYDLCVAAAKTVMRERPDILPIATHFTRQKKAGTPDVISNCLEALNDQCQLPADARLGALTTQIYQLSTHLDLQRIARYFGIRRTHAAGNPSDPKVIEARTPATYLSEVLRTLRAAVNLAQEQEG